MDENEKRIIKDYMSALARRRWAKVSPEERQKHMQEIAKKPRNRKRIKEDDKD